ncbi:MAG: hypothetical protein WAN36_12270, partial [Calditrichia bacterium]
MFLYSKPVNKVKLSLVCFPLLFWKALVYRLKSSFFSAISLGVLMYRLKLIVTAVFLVYGIVCGSQKIIPLTA